MRYFLLNSKLDYYTIVNGAIISTTKTSQVLYNSRKLSDYHYILIIAYDTNGYRSSMFLPRGMFTSSTSVYSSLTWVDSTNAQFWVEVTYQNDTHVYIQGKANTAGKYLNMYGML